MTTKAKIHITADVPEELVEKVDSRVEELGLNRSFAIRKGLELFLLNFRQELTETVKSNDESAILVTEH